MTQRKMKDSGVAWIGQVPEGWNRSRLKNHVVITTGNLDTQDANPDGEYPFYVRSPIVERSDTYTFEGPGILMAGDGAGAGRVFHLAQGRYAVHQRVYRLFDFRNIDVVFLWRYLSEMFPRVMDMGSAQSTVPSVRMPMLTNLMMFLPPLPEQRKIAAFLDGECGKIDELRGKVEKQIAALEEYRKSVITETVTKGIKRGRKMKPSGVEWIGEVPAEWCVLRVKNVGTSRNGLTYSPNDVVNESDGTLVLRSSNVQRGKLVVEDCVYVKTMVPKEIRIAKGDILICSRNGSRELIGKNALIESDINASFGAFMMVFRSCGADCKYLYWILNSTMFGYYFGAFSTSTINQLTRKDFGEMRIPTPTIPEQREIAAYLDRKCATIDSMVAKCREELDRLAEYKKSLIYEYVTGKKEVA